MQVQSSPSSVLIWLADVDSAEDVTVVFGDIARAYAESHVLPARRQLSGIRHCSVLPPEVDAVSYPCSISAKAASSHARSMSVPFPPFLHTSRPSYDVTRSRYRVETLLTSRVENLGSTQVQSGLNPG